MTPAPMLLYSVPSEETTMPDDLKIDVPASSGVNPSPVPPTTGLREIGPESEVRGGPEAPEDEAIPGQSPPSEATP